MLIAAVREALAEQAREVCSGVVIMVNWFCELFRDLGVHPREAHGNLERSGTGLDPGNQEINLLLVFFFSGWSYCSSSWKTSMSMRL